jgi:hypothetical protein
LPPPAEAATWTQFRDPKEGAFSIDVPQGWQVVGGLVRRSLNQPHPVISVLSPDKLTKIIVGDPSAIAFAELTSTLQGLGFREGQSYTPKGEPEIIRNYQTGQQWSEHLARNELQQDNCTNVAVTGSRVLPNTKVALAMPQGVERRDTTGETLLTAECNRILYTAYGFSETGGDYYHGANGAIIAGAWTDDTSTVLLTPQGNGPEAIQLAAHMLESLRFDPQWWQRQFKTAVAASRYVYDHAMNMLQQQAASFDRPLRGVAAYTNPSTGKQLEVQITGADNFAQTASGTVIGFMGSEAPPGSTILRKNAR